MECKDCMNFDICENDAKNTDELCDNFNANTVTIGDDETETDTKDFDKVKETTDKAGDIKEVKATLDLDAQIDSAINSLVGSVKNVVKDIKVSKPAQEEKPKKIFNFKFGFWQYLTTVCLVNGAVMIVRAIFKDKR